MSTRAPVIALLLVAGTHCPCGRAGDINEYLAKDGKLRERVELRDEQLGFAGATGTGWLIEPSGEWKVIRIVDGTPQGDPIRSGTLNDRQIAALANHLASHDLLGLPARLGEEPKVNPRRVTLAFGAMSFLLFWTPGSDLRDAAPERGSREAAAWARYVALVLVVQHWTREETAKAGRGSGDGLMIAQQTAYQVDPIKVRLVGREEFKVHRLDVIATVPASYADAFRKGDPIPPEPKGARQPNGKLVCYGKCTDAAGLWHWGDCARHEPAFSVDVWVGRRYEYDPTGLDRPGYVIHAVRDGKLSSLDADGKVLFFNGPPRTGRGTRPADSPYRLVVNTKQQNELLQVLTMEPIVGVALPEKGR